jgi:hypothetical protein
MTHDDLIAASDALADAAEHASDDQAAGLTATAETLAELAKRDHGADHGRLARIEYTLRELHDGADEQVGGGIDDALGHIKAFRKTVEGV